MSTRHTGIGMTSQRTRARMVERLRQLGIKDEVVLAALNAIPRHIFIEEALSSRAYEEISLPIGFGQTISNPYIVARMSELLRAGGELHKVLEIGTGCGYQAAVLSRIAKEVYSVERIAPLLAKARVSLRELRLPNVRLKHADGCMGLPEAGPFDGIIMAAAATHVPPELLQQLAEGGRMILPIGSAEQRLRLIERTADGLVETDLEPVKFVPLMQGVS
ncbi:protein-L-isoaspartate(D-aspartate) O-methyltransferase [Sulfurirhabdus autotrophica]|uniref:Protein-L-isoaspartate O-methyltransferase n=1 Tax=Sulfurirhabdus autotrophica TaxID=1706046 RepID=A0A4R3YE74_9PROT|nr:protein-L-isoaspartate(D-aspartate) O-methyltransferase [Sulfurirhabdus autotrophica]TCV90376.1 protein-L-isoaspartate(D-aspartate) O-methyltransferase [Sulfurirhabdus autotrophica]